MATNPEYQACWEVLHSGKSAGEDAWSAQALQRSAARCSLLNCISDALENCARDGERAVNSHVTSVEVTPSCTPLPKGSDNVDDIRGKGANPSFGGRDQERQLIVADMLNLE